MWIIQSLQPPARRRQIPLRDGDILTVCRVCLELLTVGGVCVKEKKKENHIMGATWQDFLSNSYHLHHCDDAETNHCRFVQLLSLYKRWWMPDNLCIHHTRKHVKCYTPQLLHTDDAASVERASRVSYTYTAESRDSNREPSPDWVHQSPRCFFTTHIRTRQLQTDVT